MAGKAMVRAVTMFSVLMASSMAVPAIAGPAITLAQLGPVFSGSDATYGFAFTLWNSETVQSLGVFDYGQDGLVGDASVGMWDADGNLLASAVVPAGTGATLIGDFRWVPIAPLVLTAGATYYVGAIENSDIIDPFVELDPYDPTGTVDANVAGRYDHYAFGNTLTWPEYATGLVTAYLGGNFSSDAVAAPVVVDAPEPASLAVLAVGFTSAGLLRRRRNNA